MARFDDAIGYVLVNEGIYSEHPQDPGGPTKYGISLRWLKSQGELGDIDEDGDIDGDDVRALSRSQAMRFYLMGFWQPLKLDLLDSQAIATRVFDIAVNAGGRAAVKIAQEAFNAFKTEVDLRRGEKAYPRLKVDGKLGPKTRAALNLAAETDNVLMMIHMREAHAAFYKKLVECRPELDCFLTGWLRRAMK
jgi:lysozyme family protein